MFESLKKKLKSLLGTQEPEEEKSKKTKEKTKKTPKTTKKTSPKKTKVQKEIKKDIEKTEETIPEKKEEGFFSKLFKKKEEVEEESTIEIKEELETKKEESFISKIFHGKTQITQKEIDDIFSELEIILLENNVSLEVVDKIKESLSTQLIGTSIKKDDLEKTVTEALKEAISSVLIEPPSLVDSIKSNFDIYTIVFFGINGSGKTTSVAKMAHYLKSQGISCVLAAGDTFRAASIEQLKHHGEKLGIPVITHTYGSDPAAVAFEAQQYARKHNISCVLVDTAGRMYTRENLMKEMEKVIRVVKPNLKIFVGESITGNDATEQARTFSETVGIDGVILTKADVDDKGGTALSVSYITQKPIYFLGMGQTYNDLKPFKKELILKHLGL